MEDAKLKPKGEEDFVKKGKNIFSKDTENAIIEYNNTEDYKTQQDLSNEHFICV